MIKFLDTASFHLHRHVASISAAMEKRKLKDGMAKRAVLGFLKFFDKPASLMAMIAIYIAVQLIVSFNSTDWKLAPWIEKHTWWDSGWYWGIAMRGYDRAQAFAFFPLWPVIIRWASRLLSTEYIYLVGLGLSFACYLAALWRLSPLYSFSRIQKPLAGYNYIGTRSYIELLPIIFAPGAWVYFSNHTEGVFLLLSVLAFQSAFEDKLIPAAMFAGLAALTKNQGVLLSVSIGLYFLLSGSGNDKKDGGVQLDFKRFMMSGLISGAFYAGWIYFQYQKTGNLLASVEIQKAWGTVHSPRQYISNMFITTTRYIDRGVLFWGILGTGGYLALFGENRKYTLPIGFYLASSVLLWPMQELQNFQQAFRFSLVIFPFWLVIGRLLRDFLASYSRVKVAIATTAIVITSLQMIDITHWFFYKTEWPY